ncbi:MAG: BACON domain-containing carbohydrate-binding protein [Paludibacter sp.]|nr:BACON domain-containing carbohydrate-binding protein [Paludibacter sp.]
MKKTTQSILLTVAFIALGSLSAFAQPTASAPTPTVAASSVISIFSNAYTNVAGTNFFPGWGQVTTYDAITVGTTDNVIKYANMNYQGVQFGSTQDVSSMKYLHIDVWSNDDNATTFPITLIWGAEKTITKTIATNGTWTSLDIPLTEFTGANLATAIQFKFQSNEWFVLGAASSTAKYTTIYLDNLYFWTDVAPTLTVSTSTLTIDQPVNSTKTFDITSANSWTVASDQTWLTASNTSGTGNATVTLTAQANTTYIARTANITVAGSSTTKTIVVKQTQLIPAAAPTPTNVAAKVKSVYSDSYTPAVTVTAFDNWWDMSISDCTYSAGNSGKVITTTASGNCGSPTFVATPLDVTDMAQIHVDVFPASTIDVGLKLVTVANGESAGWVSLGTLTPNQWNSVNVPLSSFVMSAKTDIKQVGFVTTNSFGTFYIDNLYFHDGTTSVNNINADKSISVYPTTISDKLNIKSEKEINEVVIRNLLGQTLQIVSVNGFEKSINLNSLSSGNYFVTVKLSNGQLSTQKFVKL